MEAQWEGNLDTFGGFALSFDGLCLRDDGSRSRKVWNLLSYLILNRERDLGVAELYQLLWQDKDEENPYGSLKTLVFRVRRLFKMSLSALRAYSWCFFCNYNIAAVLAVICRDPVAPP